MGVTLAQKQMDQMAQVLSDKRPTMGADADYLSPPKIVAACGAATTFGVLLSVNLGDGGIRTVMMNPVVSRALAQLISFANGERLWWSDEGVFVASVPYSEEQRAQLDKAARLEVPPVPGMREFETAPSIVSLFGGSNEAGLVLNLRAEDDSVTTWMLNPVVAWHLLGMLLKAGELARWWDEDLNFVLAEADA